MRIWPPEPASPTTAQTGGGGYEKYFFRGGRVRVFKGRGKRSEEVRKRGSGNVRVRVKEPFYVRARS